MEVRLGKVGKIIAGDDTGHYVKVIDDREDSGGFLILIAKTQDMQDGYDSWVEDEKALYRFFEESRWIVDWPC
ncbi:hypothetical protein BURK2_02421 [Burkholderiales bacterium]|nr:hypothetical protein BURK2_02421 [Burkholderiales bacterium]